MSENELSQSKGLLPKLERRGVLLTHGHFVLKSGLHSDSYVNKDLLTYDPVFLEYLVDILVFENGEKWKGRIDLVISPANGAILLGGMIARQLECKFLFTEKDEFSGQVIRPSLRGKLQDNQRVLIVDDVLTQGTTISEIVGHLPVSEIQVACIWDRSEGPVLNLPVVSLIRKQLPQLKERYCIWCREGQEISTIFGHGQEFLDQYGVDPDQWPANRKTY